MEEKKSNKIVIIVLILFATIISLFCCVSIINKSNFLSIDVSVWINIAKMMEQGKVIYRDIFDNKGPILYLLYFLGNKFGGNTGVWILNYLSALIDVAVVSLICKKLEIEKKKSLIVLSISMIFLSFIYCDCYTENPCAESIALPIILLSLYKFIKFDTDSIEFGKKESLFTRNLFRNSFAVET